jgi:hypothetical protein
MHSPYLIIYHKKKETATWGKKKLRILNPPSKKNENLLHASRLRVAGERGRILKNRGKKTTPKFLTSQLATRSRLRLVLKKLAVDFGHNKYLKKSLIYVIQ